MCGLFLLTIISIEVADFRLSSLRLGFRLQLEYRFYLK